MTSGKYFFVIVSVFLVSCDGRLEPFKIQRDISFNTNMGKNLETLKSLGVYDELGSEFTSTYSFLEIHADQIYKEVEDSANKAVELYNDFIEMYTSSQKIVMLSVIIGNDKNKNPALLEMGSINNRLVKYDQVIANDSIVGLHYKPMLQKLQQQNYALADKMNKIILNGLKELENLNNTMNSVQKNIPTDEAIRKMIDSKIDSFKTFMKTGQNLLNKNMNQIVDNAKKNLDSGLDKKIVQEVGMLKLYSLRQNINFRCDEVFRKINRTERAMENSHDNGVSFVAKVNQKVQKVFIDYGISELVNKALLKKNFETIDYYINLSYTTTASSNSVGQDETAHGSVH